MLNKCLFVGRLTRDPEVRFVNGTAVVNLGLAMNEKFKNKEGALIEKAAFAECEAWGSGAEVIGNSFRKGDRMLVEAKLQTQSWKAEDGSNRSKNIFRIESFRFVDFKKSDGETPAEASPAVAAAKSDDTNIPF